MNTRLIILAIFTTVLCSTGIAQRAHFTGSSLVITDGARRMRLPDVIDPDSEYRVIHAVQKRADDYFVVFGVCEWSRGYPPRGGRCGSGVESHIDWCHIRNGKIVQRQSGLYESCFQNRDGWSIEWKHGMLYWSTEGQRRVEEGGRSIYIPTRYMWTFDPVHPDKGIEERSEDVKQLLGSPP